MRPDKTFRIPGVVNLPSKEEMAVSGIRTQSHWGMTPAHRKTRFDVFRCLLIEEAAKFIAHTMKYYQLAVFRD
jgi:hypothetical protein